LGDAYGFLEKLVVVRQTQQSVAAADSADKADKDALT